MKKKTMIRMQNNYMEAISGPQQSCIEMRFYLNFFIKFLWIANCLSSQCDFELQKQIEQVNLPCFGLMGFLAILSGITMPMLSSLSITLYLFTWMHRYCFFLWHDTRLCVGVLEVKGMLNNKIECIVKARSKMRDNGPV